MAAEDEKKPTAADKGKGKATNGEAEQQEVQKDKDGKPMDDKKGAPPAGMPTPDCSYAATYKVAANRQMQRSSARKTSS